MRPISRTIRLFVSSTFSDLKAERNALQAEVFPRLQKYCQENGWSFQAIDLRWGVSNEATLDQSTMRICLAEIARCQVVTPRPNFLVLLGDRYGWRPLPDAVPAAEFDALRNRLPADIVEQLLWRHDQSDDAKGWYRLDENAVVALPDGSGTDRGVYMLQPRSGRFAEDDSWTHEVEQPLGAALRHAAQAEWPDSTDARRIKFEASATEQEIVAGALAVEDAHEHVHAYLRRIDLADGTALRDAVSTVPDLRQYTDFVDVLDDGRLDTEAMDRLQALKRRLSGNVRHGEPEYAARWQDDGPSNAHLDQFVADVYRSLFELIDVQIRKHTDVKPAEEEPLRHWLFAEGRAREFTGRKADLELIDAHVRGIGPAPPLIVHGESGTGKSALLAQAALRLRERRNQIVIARFVGATPDSGDMRSLLEGLCRELGTLYGASNDNLTLDANSLAAEFHLRLALATAARPLVLFIDALDLLPSDTAGVLAWLPRQTGPHVRLIVSTLPGALLETLAREVSGATRHVLPPMSSEDGEELLSRLLAAAARRLTESQARQVMTGFANANGSPLYLRLAFETARQSDSHEAELALGLGVTGVLQSMFQRLVTRSRHDTLLVDRVLGYLGCARQGLSEGELLQLLARDEAYWPHFLHSARHALPAGENGQPVRQVPVLVWSRLLHELEPYLSWRNAHGASVMTFFHPTTFALAVQAQFVSSADARRQRHKAMARHFVEAARGEDEDRPWRSDDVRAFAECVYHRVNAGDLEGSSELLTDLAFVVGKIRHRLVFELIDDYRMAIDALPEVQAELEEERRQQARLTRWGDEVTEYARQWSWLRDAQAQRGALADGSKPELPTPPATCRMWTDAEIAEECRRITDQPARVDRLRAFERFVRAQSYPLIEHGWREGFVAQHVVAVSPGGPVALAAQPLIHGSRAPMLMRSWPPGSAWNPKPALLAALEGHSHPVMSVSLSADGRRAVSGGGFRDSTLRVWDLDSGQCLRTLEGHGDEVLGVGLTSDGRRAVSGSLDRTLRIWDLELGQCQRTLEVDIQLLSVSLTPDGRRAVTGSSDKILRVWDLHSGQCLHTLSGHSNMVTSVSLTPDGRRAVSGSDHEVLRVWDLESGRCLRTLEGHGGAVSVTADGRQAVSGGSYGDSTLRVWDLDSGQCLRALEGHIRGVKCVSLTPDGRRAVSGGYDQTVRAWDLESGRCLRVLTGHSGVVDSVGVTADGRRAVSGGSDHTVRVWDLESAQCEPAFADHSDAVLSVSLTPDGRRAVSGGRDNILRVWDLESGQCLRSLEGRSVGTSVSVTPDGRRVVSPLDDNTLRVWNLDSGQCLCTLEGHSDLVTSVGLTPDGRRAVSGSDDETLRVWSLDSGQCLLTLEGHSGPVSTVCLASDRRRAVSGSHDETLRLWDLESGRCLRTLEGHGGAVSSVCITPDGRRAISGSWDNTLRVWDLESGQCLHTLEGHSGDVYSIILSPNGRRAVSGGGWPDDTLRVWDLKSGQCLRTLAASSVRVSLSPDGWRAVAAIDDNTLGVLDLESGQCRAVFVAKAMIFAAALAGRGSGCLGTNRGEVVVFQALHFEDGPTILTSTSGGGTRCIVCGSEFLTPEEVLTAIREHCALITATQSPCLDLPDTAFSDSRMLYRCLRCDAPVRFNPFFAD